MSFTTAWSANAVSICQACSLSKVLRIEVSRRFLVHSTSALSDKQRADFSAMVGHLVALKVFPAVVYVDMTLLAPCLSIPQHSTEQEVAWA